MRPLLLAAAAATATALLGSACVTANVSVSGEGATTITTTPSGATVYINGNEICATTPCNWNEGDGLAQRYHLQVRKEGYQEVDFYLDKELRFFTGLFSPAGYRMPRQIQLNLVAPAGSPPPPPAGPAAPPKTPSL